MTRSPDMLSNGGFWRTILASVICLASGISAVAQSHPAPSCSGPPSLEAQLRSPASEDGYAALVAWFNQNHQPDCAARAIRAGLKFAPKSARLHYLLGLDFYSAGRNVRRSHHSNRPFNSIPALCRLACFSEPRSRG